MFTLSYTQPRIIDKFSMLVTNEELIAAGVNKDDYYFIGMDENNKAVYSNGYTRLVWCSETEESGITYPEGYYIFEETEVTVLEPISNN